MTRGVKAILWSALAVVVLAVAGIAAFIATRPPRVPGVPPQLVPPSWSEYRLSTGHQLHVGKGNIVCSDCHDYQTTGFKSPGATPCVRCHDKQASHTHEGGPEKKTDCLSCHAFAPDKTPTCLGCHAEGQGTKPAVREHMNAHATAKCTECHKPHGELSIAPKECTTCHEERALSHAQHTGTKGCMDCHTGHAPAKAALETCSTCHERPAGPKPASHDACVTCHKPHDFVAGGARACMGCHGTKPTLAATQVEKHAVCTSCHVPHAPTEAASSCKGCHADVHLNHAGSESCIGCHQPHAGQPGAKVGACTSCHASVAASDTGAHLGGVACLNCHKAHDFAPPAAKAKGALCASCHVPEKTLTAKNKGHAECSTCHGAVTHRPTPGPACATCHAKEQASAPQGHAVCTNCHEKHSGERLPQAVCANCHKPEAASAHGAVKTGCQTCHRPHGPGGIASPPVCTTCHARPTLPALHAVTKHADCTQCHTPHGPPRSDRATCTGTCHADRRDHQPQALVCTGCHVFRR